MVARFLQPRVVDVPLSLPLYIAMYANATRVLLERFYRRKHFTMTLHCRRIVPLEIVYRRCRHGRPVFSINLVEYETSEARRRSTAVKCGLTRKQRGEAEQCSKIFKKY